MQANVSSRASAPTVVVWKTPAQPESDAIMGFALMHVAIQTLVQLASIVMTINNVSMTAWSDTPVTTKLDVILTLSQMVQRIDQNPCTYNTRCQAA